MPDSSFAWSWITLVLLGSFHGLNPAMGWLFAVALGLQERRTSAVTRALAPIALGHAISIAAVAATVSYVLAAICFLHLFCRREGCSWTETIVVRRADLMAIGRMVLSFTRSSSRAAIGRE